MRRDTVHPPGERGALPPLRVLLVDDEPHAIRNLCFLLDPAHAAARAGHSSFAFGVAQRHGCAVAGRGQRRADRGARRRATMCIEFAAGCVGRTEGSERLVSVAVSAASVS